MRTYGCQETSIFRSLWTNSITLPDFHLEGGKQECWRVPNEALSNGLMVPPFVPHKEVERLIPTNDILEWRQDLCREGK